jgi:hypothetical protein
MVNFIAELLRAKEGGVQYQLVGNWARFIAGLDAVVKRIFALSGNEPCQPRHYRGLFLYLKLPETPFYKGILTLRLVPLCPVSMTEANVREIPVSGD